MTDKTTANGWNDFVRTLMVTIFDRPAYWLLGLMYQIFFNVSSADLFSNATILGFYKRIQLIIGVFMIFQLAVTIMKGIISPDEAFGSKSGIGSIITRVVMSLVLLTVLVPVSNPGATTEYEKQINNNGLLFGTLYSLQHRILANNTLGRLVLGTTDGTDSSSQAQGESLARSSRIFTSTILKGFVRINLVPEEYRKDPGDGRTEEMLNENRICKDIDDAILDTYTKIDADPGEILSLINADCTPSSSDAWLSSDVEKSKSNWYEKLTGKKRYVFSYIPILSAVVAFVFVFILLSFTVEVAIRAAKLAVLRLIAPIPIISYMDPKGGKDGAFNAWVKALTSTYIDLFLRLAIVYFVIYLIQDMIVNGIVMDTGSGMIGVLSAIFIWIGLFLFAREAPKFIRQVLGMKEDSGRGIFGGLRGLATIGAVGAGTVGSLVTGYQATSASRDARGKSNNPFVNVGGALTNAIAGGAGAIKDAMDPKARASTIMSNMRSRNNNLINNAMEGSSFGGRLGSRIRSTFGGDTLAMQDERKIEANKQFADLYKAIAAKADVMGAVTTSSGATYNAKDLKEKWERMKTSGTYSEAQLKAAEDAYKQAQAKTIEHAISSRSGIIYEYYQRAKGITDTYGDILVNPAGGTYDLTVADDFKKAHYNATDINNSMKMGSGSGSYNAHKADDKAVGKK